MEMTFLQEKVEHHHGNQKNQSPPSENIILES